MRTMFLWLMVSIFLTGCTMKGRLETDESKKQTEQKSEENETMVYTKISPKEAKEIMDSEKDIIILDVRTEEEYNKGHIENAVLLSDFEISDKAEEVIPDKQKKILLYCRSGKRSSAAAKVLVTLGYKNVLDFGGIIDWEYKTVK